MAGAHAPWPPTRAGAATVLLGGGLAVLLVGMLWLVVQVTAAGREQADQASRLVASQSKVEALATLAADNQAKLTRLGQKPVGPPAASVAAQPPAAIPVAAGPSDAQVWAAVVSYCASARCVVSAASLTAAVVAYCASRPDRCTGAAGRPGSPGAAGEPGPTGAPGGSGAPGAPGGGPSDARVASAVAEYCSARADCSGATGPPGPAGAVGAEGPGGAPGPSGPPGPAGPGCPSGYELAAVQYPDGRAGVACVVGPPGPVPTG